MNRAGFSGFDWDAGNRLKCQKHGLSIAEIEYALEHAEALIAQEPERSTERRLLAIGRTQAGRYAFVVVTPRRTSLGNRLRPISARYMYEREIIKYAQEIARVKE
jgi:uncharacterized protein